MKTITKLDSNKPLIFLGDNHGAWNEIFSIVDYKKIENCYIISVGDLGVGFHSKNYPLYETLNFDFKEKNINFYGIRGNHDDPSFFKGSKRIVLTNFELIEDYSIFQYNNQTIQFIGGAVSIDRTGRKEGVSYWLQEGVEYKKDLLKEVDVLVTHTAPSQCFPQQFNERVYGWAGEDAYLIEDLTDERAVMDEIFKKCKPKYHYYGHFHSSWSEEINECKHRLLDINELYEHKV